MAVIMLDSPYHRIRSRFSLSLTNILLNQSSALQILLPTCQLNLSGGLIKSSGIIVE